MNATVIELLEILKLILEQKEKKNGHWEVYLTEEEIAKAERLLREAKKLRLI
jgi:hypothetical protein